MRTKKIVSGIIGLAVAFIIGNIPPPETLTQSSMYAIGFLVGGIIWMVAETAPDYVCAMFIACGWVFIGKVPFSAAFATYNSTTYILQIGALIIGACAAATGLLKRITYLLLRTFPTSFHGQSLGLTIAGLVCGPLIPSATAKAAIVGPIARTLSDEMGYGENSKGSAGIFLSYLSGFSLSAPVFLSSSVVAYTMIGTWPEGTSPVSWVQWFLYMLPWSIVYLVLMTGFINIWYNPKGTTRLSREYVQCKYEELGKLTGKERTCTIVVLAALILWILERVIGLSSAITAFGAAAVLLALGVISRQDLRSKVAWDSLIFIGTMVSISNVFSATGVSDYIGSMLGPIMTPIMGNPWIMVPVLCVLTYLVRFVVTAWTAGVTLMMGIMIPIAAAFGIHPFVVGICIYTSVNSFNTTYQNVVYISARVSTGGTMCKHSQAMSAAIAFMIINILGCMACIPVWQALGFC